MADSYKFGPELFAAEAISAETNAVNEGLAKASHDAPAGWEVPLAMERDYVSGPMRGIFSTERVESAIARTIPGPAGAIPIRIFMPPIRKVSGVYVHIHGGAFCLGSHETQDRLLNDTARDANVAVVSVGYRLAPENPYPAAPADCEAAVWWAINCAKKEFGADRIVVGGESAGAHLAVVVALRLRDRRSFTDLAGLNLVYGGYDLDRATPSMQRAAAFYKPFKIHMDRYLPPGPMRHSPDVSPIFADFDKMPPALITVGTLDPTLDDNMFLYMRWIAARNKAELAVYPGAVHAFTLVPLFPLAKEANDRCSTFIAECCNNRGAAGAA